MGGPVDPVEGIYPRPPGESNPGAEHPAPEQTFRRSIRGRITAVHRGAPHAPEHHLLDVTVGESPYQEIVIRVGSANLDGLVGRDVIINFD